MRIVPGGSHQEPEPGRLAWFFLDNASAADQARPLALAAKRWSANRERRHPECRPIRERATVLEHVAADRLTRT